MARVKAVALTGGIASGKSLAARRFAEWGIPVIDSDVIAREIVEPGEPAFSEIIERFGTDILLADGRLDRAALRERVFWDPTARADLERITHPRIRERMREQAEKASGPYQLHVIPLLAESGRAREFDRIVVVDCDPALQKKRLQQRDATSSDTAEAMLAAQASREARLAIADDVLSNEGSPEALLAAVDRLHQNYVARWATSSG